MLNGERSIEGWRTDARLLWDPDRLAEPLQLCYRSLRETGAGIIADGRLSDVIRRVVCFGLSLVRLDLRQEASRHTEALDAISRHAGLGSYTAWDEAQRMAFLSRQLQDGDRALTAAFAAAARLPPQVDDVIGTLQQAATLPRGVLGAYVISFAMRPSDVLAVELLQKEAHRSLGEDGLAHRSLGVGGPLRVVPLFETIDALVAEAAGYCLLAIDADTTRTHLGCIAALR